MLLKLGAFAGRTSHCNTAIHCNTLHNTATQTLHLNVMFEIPRAEPFCTYYFTLQRNATHCNYCNTLNRHDVRKKTVTLVTNHRKH